MYRGYSKGLSASVTCSRVELYAGIKILLVGFCSSSVPQIDVTPVMAIAAVFQALGWGHLLVETTAVD
jgi:hypothetical protein